MLANSVEVDPIRGRLPFEVEQAVDLVVSRLPTWEDQGLVADWLAAPALIQDSCDQLRIVSWPHHVFERLALILFVPIFRDF
jgi:hypothetical protein